MLFSIGLVFMSISTAHYFFGAQQQPLQLPDFLRGQFNLPGLDIGVYRLFLIVRRAGDRRGPAVDAHAYPLWRRAARLGRQPARRARPRHRRRPRLQSRPSRSARRSAGLGGALGIEMLGLDPEFPVKYIVYFLIVVAVGGSGNILGSLYASLILGISDVAGKYYLPQVGAFVIYAVMVVTLIFRPQGLFGRGAAK